MCGKQMGSRRRNQNRQEETRADGIRQRIAETANAPKDVIMGLPLIHLTGQCEVSIENYRGIQEYTQELIRVKTKAGTIRITGKRMCIEYYMNDEMKITGKIWKVEFEKKEEPAVYKGICPDTDYRIFSRTISESVQIQEDSGLGTVTGP